MAEPPVTPVVGQPPVAGSVPVDAQPPGTAGIAPSAAPSRAMTVSAAAMLLMTGNILSRMLGLVREQIASNQFGTGDAMAAFTVADNVQTMLFDLAVSGMLQAALIPVLTQWAADDAASRAELRRAAGALMTVVLTIVGVATLAGVAFAPAIVRGMTALFGDGDARGVATTDLTVTLVRWILPAVFLLAIGTVLMAVLYAIGRVAVPALSLALRNAAVVATVLVFGGALGVRSLALGVVIGAAAIVVALIWPLRTEATLPRPNLAVRHPAVKETFRLYLPIGLGLVVSTVAVAIDRNLGWGAGEDALGAMRYATTLVQFVLGLVAAAISLAALPALARHHAGGDEPAFRATLGRALSMTTLLILPATLGLAAVAVPAVALLFGHGATDAAGERAIVVALLGYLPGTLFAAFDQVLIFAFYARKRTLTPVLVGLLSVVVYLVVAFSLVERFGMLGLVVANSAQFVAHAIVMLWLAERAFGPVWTAGWRALLRQTGPAALLAAALALVSWLGVSQLWPGAGLLPESAALLLPTLAGVTVYAGMLHRWRVAEFAELWRLTLGRLTGRG